MPLQTCEKKVFDFYFQFYNENVVKKEKNFEKSQVLETIFEFKLPYLPAFGDQSWALMKDDEPIHKLYISHRSDTRMATLTFV